MSNKKFINLNPDITRKFIRAVSRGYIYSVDHPDEAAKILCETVPELPYDLVLESQRYLSKEYLSDAKCFGYIDKNRWDAFYKWMFDNGITKTKIYERDVICNDYLQERF